MPKGEKKTVEIDVGHGFTLTISSLSWNVTHEGHTTYHGGPVAALKSLISRMETAQVRATAVTKIEDILLAFQTVDKRIPDVVQKMDDSWHRFLGAK